MNKNVDKYSPKILNSSDIIAGEKAQEKAIQLAVLEDEIFSLVKSLNKQITINSDLFVTQQEKQTTLHFMDVSLFYQERIDIILSAYKKSAYHEKINVDTPYKLSLQFFSDREMLEAFKIYASKYPTQARYDFETFYFFDKVGHFAKVIRLPNEIETTRQPIFDYEGEKDYSSQMTKEDFISAERALTLTKTQIEDYLVWSKPPQPI